MYKEKHCRQILYEGAFISVQLKVSVDSFSICLLHLEVQCSLTCTSMPLTVASLCAKVHNRVVIMFKEHIWCPFTGLITEHCYFLYYYYYYCCYFVFMFLDKL